MPHIIYVGINRFHIGRVAQKKYARKRLTSNSWHTFSWTVGSANKPTRRPVWDLGKSMRKWHTFSRNCRKLAYNRKRLDRHARSIYLSLHCGRAKKGVALFETGRSYYVSRYTKTWPQDIMLLPIYEFSHATQWMAWMRIVGRYDIIDGGMHWVAR